MGISGSKMKFGKRKKDGSEGTNIPDSLVDDYEDVELMLIRKSIKRDPESFILNNLMMCVQFFDNYEE